LHAAALLAVVCAAVLALRWYVYLPVVCEARVTRALQALNDAAELSTAMQLAAARSAEAALSGCDCVAGTDFKYTYVHGTALRSLGDPAHAITSYRRALTIARRPEIYLALGFAQLEALDRPGAIDSFARAAAFSPAQLERIPYDDVRAEVAARTSVR
jgi:tetratricopeptide (TPR) repeat protein